MQSTEGCWMVVHPCSKCEKAEMSADFFYFFCRSIFEHLLYTYTFYLIYEVFC